MPSIFLSLFISLAFVFNPNSTLISGDKYCVSRDTIEKGNYIEYYRLIYLAENSFCNDEIENAIRLYQKAFNLCTPLKRDVVNYSRCLIRQGKVPHDSIRAMIINVAEKKSGSLEYWIKKDPILDTLLVDGFYEKIVQLEKAGMKDLPEEIKLLLELDQLPRHEKKYESSISLIDSFIVSKFIDYVKTNGYPGYFKYGTDIVSIMLVHWVDKASFSLVNSLLKQELMKGNLMPYEYGYFLDRWYADRGECGLGLLYTKAICTPADSAFVSDRRASIGLFRLDFKAMRFYKLPCER